MMEQKVIKTMFTFNAKPFSCQFNLVSDVDYLTHWKISKPTYLKVIVYVTDADVLAAEL